MSQLSFKTFHFGSNCRRRLECAPWARTPSCHELKPYLSVFGSVPLNMTPMRTILQEITPFLWRRCIHLRKIMLLSRWLNVKISFIDVVDQPRSIVSWSTNIFSFCKTNGIVCQYLKLFGIILNCSVVHYNLLRFIKRLTGKYSINDSINPLPIFD